MEQGNEIGQKFWQEFKILHAKHWLQMNVLALPLMSALLYLRWVEFICTEQDAVTKFAGVDYEPVLPEAAHFHSFQNLTGDELQQFVTHQLAPALSGTHVTPFGPALNCAAEILKDGFSLLPYEVASSLVKFTSFFDFGSETGRKAAGAFLEKLANHFRNRESSEEYSMPQVVIDLMVEIASPKPGDRVYAPCLGLGDLLVASAKRMRQTAQQPLPKEWQDGQQGGFFGITSVQESYIVGLARLVLSGIDNPCLELGNALEQDTSESPGNNGFDCILANPPWIRYHRSQYQFPIKSSNSETLFLQHIMASLRPEGRAVVLVSEGLLFRTGPERLVRKKLLTEFRVDGIISLPEMGFFPYSNIKTNILFFRRGAPVDSVRFLIVPPEEWRKEADEKIGGRRSAENLAPDIAHRFRAGKPDKNLWDTPIKAIRDRDWDLIATRIGGEDLDRIFKAVRQAAPNIKILHLSKIAEVIRGVSYNKSFTTKNPRDPDMAGRLLRVADIGDRSIKKPTLFVTQKAIKRIDEQRRVQEKDILLSTSGTVGKTAVASDMGDRTFHANSIAVIRPKSKDEGVEILPEYLVALLRSPAYQNWLKGNARGNVIQHLSIRILRNMPVPVPAIPLQIEFARKFEKVSKLDLESEALVNLLTTLTKKEDHPFLIWLNESSEVQNILNWKERAQTERLNDLDRFATKMCEHLEIMLNSREYEDALPEAYPGWLAHMAGSVHFNGIAGLKGIANIPAGPVRFLLIRIAIDNLKEIFEIFGDSKEIPSNLMNIVLELLNEELKSLVKTVSVSARLDPEHVVVGQSAEITLYLNNASLLPLRNVTVTTDPDFGGAYLPYFDDGQEAIAVVKIPAQVEAGQVVFQVVWDGENLAGMTEKGIIPLAIEVLSLRDQVRNVELGASPYIAGPPIDREEMFFGRYDIIDQIKLQLRTSHKANVILLEGNRRTGKSSILKRLESEGMLPEWVVVHCDFSKPLPKDKRGLSTTEFYKFITMEIGKKAYKLGFASWPPNFPPPDPAKKFEPQFILASRKAFSSYDYPADMFEVYLQEVINGIRPRRLLLLLDEFDKLQEGMLSGVMSPSVPGNIRSLLHAYDFTAIISGSRRMKEWRNEYWSPLFGFGYPIRVSALSQEDARLLVTQPVEGRLYYVPAARDLVISLCAGFPFLIQQLCNKIFLRTAKSKQPQRSITLEVVEQAVTEMVTDSEHFRTLWDEHLDTDRQRFIMALCTRLSEGPDPMSFSLLELMLEKEGVNYDEKELSKDIDLLLTLELLKMDTDPADAVYRIGIPLMARWIKQHIDFSQARRRAVKEGMEAI